MLVLAVLVTISACGLAGGGSGNGAAAGSETAASSSVPLPAHQPVWMDSVQMVSATAGWKLIFTSNPYKSSVLAVARTTDGGRTWQRSAPIAASQPIAIDVIGRRGWLLQSLGAAMGSNPVRVYRTIDAGQSWSLAAQSGTGRAAAHGLVTGCDKVGMGFGAADLGPYPRVQFFGPSDAIAVSAGSQGSVGSTFFVTSNGGLSWSAVPQGRHFGRGGASFDFISPTSGFAWLVFGINAASPPPRVYRTSDSGRTWTSFVPRLG